MLENKSLTQSILEHLRTQIITSKLNPGQRLNEKNLASELSVSRPPLREALQILEQENFVVCIPRKGRYVAALTWGSYEKIHEARLMMECHVIDVLKERNQRKLPRVERALEKIPQKRLATDDPSETFSYFQATNEFHPKLVESIENEILDRFYGVIRSNIYRYHYWLRVLRSPDSMHNGTLSSVTQQHYRILDLIHRGKFGEAKESLKQHMDGTRELLREKLLAEPVTSKGRHS